MIFCVHLLRLRWTNTKKLDPKTNRLRNCCCRYIRLFHRNEQCSSNKSYVITPFWRGKCRLKTGREKKAHFTWSNRTHTHTEFWRRMFSSPERKKKSKSFKWSLNAYTQIDVWNIFFDYIKLKLFHTNRVRANHGKKKPEQSLNVQICLVLILGILAVVENVRFYNTKAIRT